MKTAAVIAEYNPFHSGHAKQLYDIKHQYHADVCVVIMSGNFVQRGTPAIVNKFTRASWALQYGADIVFELPTVFATAGAEQFAEGACSLFHKLGFIDMLFFGSEITDKKLFEQMADILLHPPITYHKHLKELLCQGKSYAAAREEALFPFLCNDPSIQKLLSTFSYHSHREAFHAILSAPNTILGLEYCKALKKLNSHITPVPILRQGSGYHDTTLPSILCTSSEHSTVPTPVFASASAIRTHLFHCQNEIDTLRFFLPDDVLEELKMQTLIHENDFSSCLYYALLGKTAQDLTQYYEVSDQLANRILKYLPQFQDFSHFTTLLKNKSLSHARIHRALLHILLSISKEIPFQKCQYLRLLALKKEVSHLLRFSSCPTELTIITKPAKAYKKLSEQDILSFQKDIEVSNLYNFIAHQKGNQHTSPEMQTSPIILS